MPAPPLVVLPSEGWVPTAWPRARRQPPKQQQLNRCQGEKRTGRQSGWVWNRTFPKLVNTCKNTQTKEMLCLSKIAQTGKNPNIYPWKNVCGIIRVVYNGMLLNDLINNCWTNTTTWTNLTGITQSERSWTQRRMNYVTLSIWNSITGNTVFLEVE